MRFGEVDLFPVLFEGANGGYHLGFLLEKLHEEDDFGDYLPFLCCFFELVNPLLLAPVLDSLAGCHPSEGVVVPVAVGATGYCPQPPFSGS